MNNCIFTNIFLTQSGRKDFWFKHTKGGIHPGLRSIRMGCGSNTRRLAINTMREGESILTFNSIIMFQI